MRAALLLPALAAAWSVLAPVRAVAASDPAAIARRIAAAEADFDAGRHDRALTTAQAVFAETGRLDVLYFVGRCHQELGQLEDALGVFERVLDGDVPPEFRLKVAHIADELRRRLATGRLLLQIAPFGAEVRVDGARAGRAPLDRLELLPGEHELVVLAPGYVEARRVVTLRGGRDERVVVALEPLSAPPAPPPEPPAPLSLSPWTWVTLGTGVAALAAGTTVYLLGERDHRSIVAAEGYDGGPVVAMSRPRALALEQSGDDKKLAGYVLWGVGGAATLTSIALFVVEAATQPAESGITVGVTPALRGGLWSIQGRF